MLEKFCVLCCLPMSRLPRITCIHQGVNMMWESIGKRQRLYSRNGGEAQLINARGAKQKLPVYNTNLCI